jgi:hypothetical protein
VVPVPGAPLHRRQHRPLRPHNVHQRLPRARPGHRRCDRGIRWRERHRAGMLARAGAREVRVPVVQGEPPCRPLVRDVRRFSIRCEIGISTVAFVYI